MKKVLLRIGFTLCFLLSSFFLDVFINSAKLGTAAVLFSLFPAAGPVLGTIALWNELKNKRSKKILIALCVWGSLFALFWFFVLNSHFRFFS